MAKCNQVTLLPFKGLNTAKLATLIEVPEIVSDARRESRNRSSRENGDYTACVRCM